MSESIPPSEPWDESEHPGGIDNDMDSALDIDSALASVSTLSDVIAQQEADEAAEVVRAEVEQQETEQAEKQRSAYYFARPQPYHMVRGQLASVIPALALMLLGAWLTFTLSTSETTPDPTLVALIVGAAFGLCLIVYWLSSGRWSAGAGFLGLASILVVATLYLSSSTTELGTEAWPLLLCAVGVAVLLTAILNKGQIERAVGTGIMLIIAGIAGFLVTTETLTEDTTNIIAALTPVVIVFFVVILLLPLVLRRRE